MNDIRQQASLDQTAAMLRDERHKLLRMLAESRKRDWYRDPHNLHVLALYMIEQCGDRDEITRVVGEVLSKPWNWRAEFVLAKCRQLDGKAFEERRYRASINAATPDVEFPQTRTA